MLRMQYQLQMYYTVLLRRQYECRFTANVQHFRQITGALSQFSSLKLCSTCTVDLFSYCTWSSTSANLLHSNPTVRRSNKSGLIYEVHRLQYGWRSASTSAPNSTVVQDESSNLVSIFRIKDAITLRFTTKHFRPKIGAMGIGTYYGIILKSTANSNRARLNVMHSIVGCKIQQWCACYPLRWAGMSHTALYFLYK